MRAMQRLRQSVSVAVIVPLMVTHVVRDCALFAGLESVCRPSGGLGAAGEDRGGSVLSQPAGHRRSATRAGRHRLPVAPAQPERLQFLCNSSGTLSPVTLPHF